MFLIIFLTFLLGLISFFSILTLKVKQSKTNLKYGGIYSVAGPFYRLKYLWIFMFLWIKKWRVNKSNKTKLLPFDLDLMRKFREMEKPQALTQNDSIDSVYFFMHSNGHEIEGHQQKPIDVIVRLARRSQQYHELWMWVSVNGGPSYVKHILANQQKGSDNSWCHPCGLRIRCIRPMENWKISYSGWMSRENEDGDQIDVHVAFKLNFRAFTNIVDSHRDTSIQLSADSVAREPWTREFFKDLRHFGEKKQTHYEQWGSYDGDICIDEHDSFSISNGKGYRDHSYGIRNWRQYRRYGTLFGYLENGSTISLGAVSCHKTLTHIRYGYLITPYGRTRPITQHNYNLWETYSVYPPKSNVNIDFVAGEDFNLSIMKVRETKFVLNEGGTLITERLVELRLNGLKGWGVNEYCSSDIAISRPLKPESIKCDKAKESTTMNANIFCLALDSDSATSRSLCGGKGGQLSELSHIYNDEIKIPDGFVITTNAYQAFIEYNPSLEGNLIGFHSNLNKMKSDIEKLKSECQKIVQSIKTAQYPEDLQKSILKSMDIRFGKNIWHNKKYAIRSSATDEDNIGSSSAGQMETILGVYGTDKLLDSIKQCWSSLYSFTAVEYRIHSHANVAMGVVVMEMIDADMAGVMFTVDPITCDHTRIIINSSYGVGEAVVSGITEPDSYVISKSIIEPQNASSSLSIISKSKGKQTISYQVLEQGGLQEIEHNLLEEEEKKLSLSDEDALKLANIGMIIENYYGDPRDIEWAIYQDQIYVLQSRPITTLDMETDEEMEHEFDSGIAYDEECLTTANIGEMMPMAVTPLTLSVFAKAIDTYLQSHPLRAGLLTEYLHPMRFIMSYSNNLFINIQFLGLVTKSHCLMGDLRGAFLALLGRILERPDENDLEYFCGRSSLWRRIYSTFFIFSSRYGCTERTQNWETKFREGYRISSDSPSASDQLDTIWDRINDYYQCWEDTVLNTSKSIIWSMALMKTLSKNKTEEFDDKVFSKIATLLSTCDDVYSADVPSAMKKMALDIRKNSEAYAIFSENNEKDCLEWLQSNNESEVGKEWNRFIRFHGHRCIREAEFRETSWRRSPEKVISVLKPMVIQLSPDDYIVKNKLTIKQAVNKIGGSKMGFFKRKNTEWILGRARNGVGSREWGKSISIQMCELFKLAFVHLAEKMVEEELLPECDLIYFLTLDELDCLIRQGQTDLVMRAQRRRKILDRQMNQSMPEICFGKPKIKDSKEFIIVDGQTQLKGFPVSPGIVTGLARVIRNLDEAKSIKPGEILIVPYTDVGWTPYFPFLGGLVTEKGGLLSHGAVVAREYGLPCIVGCIHALNSIKTGDLVQLNGSKGYVVVCNPTE